MIFFDERRNTITLSTAATTYQMKVDSTGVLLHTYYGPRLRGGDLSNRIVHEDRGFSPNPYEVGKDRTYSLDTLPQEYSSCGIGDFRLPSVEASCGNGSHTVDLRYVRHTVREGKYALEGLPAFYDEGVTAQTLSVELRDSCTGLEVELLYGVLEEYDLITRAVRVRNGGKAPMELERVSSVCLDFPVGEHDLITLGGAYAREREPVRMPLTQGVHTVGSVRGSSSHQQNPFVVLCDHETTEDAGRCWGVALVYSGSFQVNAEYTQFHETRLTLGINPFHFHWTLQPGESFTTPEAAMVFSREGLGHMSRQFHRAIRLKLCRGPWKDQRRPILINNWEATLFDFDAEKICSIAKTASQVGVEMMVMDDGWFGKRNDDFADLGDWNVNETKLPGGLGPLAHRIEEMGMKFGLWVEPETVNEDSDLYRAHPDWAFQVPGRPMTRGRSQLVLDLTRAEVRQYIMDNLRATLNSALIQPDMALEVKDELLFIANHAQFSALRLMAHFYLFLDALIDSSSSKQRVRGLSQQGFYIREAIHFIDQYYRDDIRIEQIASFCGLNRTYFSRLFKEVMGQTPQEYLARYRVNKAMELMRNTNMSIGEVASMVGYPNQLYFSKVFRKYQGLPPRVWRQEDLMALEKKQSAEQSQSKPPKVRN